MIIINHQIKDEVLIKIQMLGTEIGSPAEKVYPRLGYTQVWTAESRSDSC